MSYMYICNCILISQLAISNPMSSVVKIRGSVIDADGGFNNSHPIIIGGIIKTKFFFKKLLY